MIVDGPYTFDLTVGADRRIPDTNDAQTVIPPSVSPVVLGLKPTRFFNGFAGVTPLTLSTLIQGDLSRLNQAAISQLVCVLAPGLWELELTLATQFDYAGTVATFNGADISIVDSGGRVVKLLTRLAAVGTFSDFDRRRILILDQCNVNLDVSITGAAQHLDARVCVNAIRIL